MRHLNFMQLVSLILMVQGDFLSAILSVIGLVIIGEMVTIDVRNGVIRCGFIDGSIRDDWVLCGCFGVGIILSMVCYHRLLKGSKNCPQCFQYARLDARLQRDSF